MPKKESIAGNHFLEDPQEVDRPSTKPTRHKAQEDPYLLGSTMVYPGRGGRGRKSGGGRGRGNYFKKKSPSSSSSKTKAKKTLTDHVFYVGTATQASDFVTVKLYLTNYVRRTYEVGDDVATTVCLETTESN